MGSHATLAVPWLISRAVKSEGTRWDTSDNPGTGSSWEVVQDGRRWKDPWQTPDTALSPHAKFQTPALKQGCAQAIQQKGHQKHFMWCKRVSSALSSCAWCQVLVQPIWLDLSLKDVRGSHTAWKKSPQNAWQSFSWLKMGLYNGMNGTHVLNNACAKTEQLWNSYQSC